MPASLTGMFSLAMEEDHLQSEAAEAFREYSALNAELRIPTATRLYAAQVDLVNAAKDASARHFALLVRLKLYRGRYRLRPLVKLSLVAARLNRSGSGEF